MNERKRHRRKGRRRRRRSPGIALIISIVLVIIIAVAGIFVVWKRYGPSNERADLEQYYGLDSKDEIAVVIDDEVIRSEDLAQDEAEGLKVIPAKVYDSEYYIEASVVRDKINERFYWDSNEQILLYTLPSGNVSVVADTNEYTEVNEQKSVDYTILKMEGDKVYIALPFIQTYTNMEYKVYQDPNRIVITADWGEKETAVVKGDTQIRYQGGVKSPVLTDVKKNDKVTVLEDEDDWQKVATADGFIGYLKSSKLKDQKKEKTSRDFAEPEYTSISKDYKINMAWHNVTNVSANQSIQSMLATTKGLTTIAPTWFSLADTEGNITSIADTDYVQYAKQAGLEVWAVLRDFHGGINSYDETYEVLSYSSKRAKVIDHQLAKRLNGIQGFQHTAFHLHIRACHHGTDNLRERDCRRVFIINLESAVNQIATRIAVQALFCNIKFNERLLLHSVGNSLARSLTNYPLSFQIRQLGNGFFLLQHDYGTIGSTA